MQEIKSQEFEFIISDTQLISLLLCITKKPETGRLLKINTGEGKSVIVQIIAAYYALQGKKVDVITRNHILTERDAEESQEFFKKLELTIGCIKSKKSVEDVRPDILFRTLDNFGQELFQYDMGKNSMIQEQGMLIVDHIFELKDEVSQNNLISSISDENLKTFIKRYKSNVIWLTETLKESQNVDIPPYFPFNPKIIEPIFCENQQTWKDKLLSEINGCQSDVLPALLFFETIEKARDFGKFLTENNKRFDFFCGSEEKKENEKIKNKIKEKQNEKDWEIDEEGTCQKIKRQNKVNETLRKNKQHRNTQVNPKQENFNKKILKFENNSILLAANFGRSDTAFHIPEDILTQGGLQVFITFDPSNLRVKSQAFRSFDKTSQQESGLMIVNYFNDNLISDYFVRIYVV
jgi:hypothetical protein